MKQYKIIRRGKFYYIYKKGHKGVYSVVSTKGRTKKQVEDTLNKAPQYKEERNPKGNLYRIIQARVYEYKDELRLGQFRLEIYTYHPKKYTTKLLYSKLRKAEKYLYAVNQQFRKAMKYVTYKYYLAREVHIIDTDEKTSKNLDVIWCDVVGFGIANKYKQLRFKV